MKISPYFSSLCNMSCLFSVTVYFSYFLFTFWKFVCLLFRNLFMWDVSNQMKLNLRLKWIKTELCTKSIIWDFWKMFESDELDLLTGSMNSKNIPNFQTFPNFWKIEFRTPKFYFEDFQFKFFFQTRLQIVFATLQNAFWEDMAKFQRIRTRWSQNSSEWF